MAKSKNWVASMVVFLHKIWILVLQFWTAMLAWGVVDGLKLFTHLDNRMDSTPGTVSHEAEKTLERYFPALVTQIPWLLVVQCGVSSCGGAPGSYIVNDKTKDMLNYIESTMSDTVFIKSATQGYYKFDGTAADSLKANYLSADGNLMYVVYEADLNVDQDARYKSYDSLASVIKEAKRTYCPDCYIGITGGDPLLHNTTSGIAKLIALADLFIVPFAAAILIYMIGSWRLCLIGLYNIAVVILSAFAIIYRITEKGKAAQSITPQFVEVIAMAITIDYSLFFYTRFVQELKFWRNRWHSQRSTGNSAAIDDEHVFDMCDAEWAPERSNDKPMEDLVRVALISTLRNSGHVIMVSGCTLVCSFLGFFLSETNFLIIPAFANVIAIVLAMLASITSSIAFISGMPGFFTNFNAFPDCCYALCCSNRRKQQLGDTDFTGDELEVEDRDDLAFNASLDAVKSERLARDTSFSMMHSGDSDVQTLQFSNTSQNIYNGISNNKRAMHKSNWFRLGQKLVQCPWNIIILLITFGSMTVLALHLKEMKLSTSFELGVPEDAPAMDAIHVLESGFNPGMVTAMNVIMVFDSGKVTPATEALDMIMSAGCKALKSLTTQTVLELDDIKSVFFFENQWVCDSAAAMPLLIGNASFQATWRTFGTLAELVDPVPQPQAMRMSIHLRNVNQNLESFMNQVRLYVFEELASIPGIKFHLQGYKVSEADSVRHAKDRFPLMIGVTTGVVLVIVAILLKSVFVPVRLVLTLVLPLASTFGLAVLVYQKGILEWTGLNCFQMPTEKAFYWDVPIFCFIVLLGLALDYDVFIISRIAEFREAGFKNEAAIVKGLYETGPIITAAGLIMALSFAALMTLKSAATHQIGWLLISSVLIDTFIVRSFIVPAVMSFADKIGWWPRNVPMHNLMNIDGSTTDTVQYSQYGSVTPY